MSVCIVDGAHNILTTNHRPGHDDVGSGDSVWRNLRCHMRIWCKVQGEVVCGGGAQCSIPGILQLLEVAL